METAQRTYVCKKTYIEQGKAMFIKGKMYVGNGNHITGERSIIYMDDNAIEKYFEEAKTPKLVKGITDNVNHPSHYTKHPSGVECIDIVRHYCFAVGNAIKYLWRAGLKGDAYMTPKEKEIEDLNKAIWYIKDRIETLKKES